MGCLLKPHSAMIHSNISIVVKSIAQFSTACHSSVFNTPPLTQSEPFSAASDIFSPRLRLSLWRTGTHPPGVVERNAGVEEAREDLFVEGPDGVIVGVAHLIVHGTFTAVDQARAQSVDVADVRTLEPNEMDAAAKVAHLPSGSVR